jgi:GNAT superfamily N-acetyltransferase
LVLLENAPRRAAHAGVTPDGERLQSRNNMSNSFLSGSIPPIRPAGPADATWIADFLRDRWNAPTIAVHGEFIEAAELPALIAGDRQGLATYRALGRDAELVTLDAMPTATGTGTALIEALATRLQGEGCERLWLTTTNDKLSALRFYMRRGFRVIQARPGAVDAARKLKPTIPVIREHGIPVQEEIDLCRVLATNAAEDLMARPPWSQEPPRRPKIRHGCQKSR